MNKNMKKAIILTTLLLSGCNTKNNKEVIQEPIIIEKEETVNNDEVIIEEVRPDGYNSHTGKVLMWLQAAIVIAIYEIDPKIEIEFIYPSQWRAALKIKQGRGIKRNDLKPQDIKYIKDKYNINVNDDIADAICIFDVYGEKIGCQI